MHMLDWDMYIQKRTMAKYSILLFWIVHMPDFQIRVTSLDLHFSIWLFSALWNTADCFSHALNLNFTTDLSRMYDHDKASIG